MTTPPATTFAADDSFTGLGDPEGDPLAELGDPAAATVDVLRVAHDRHVTAARAETEARCIWRTAIAVDDADEDEQRWHARRVDGLKARVHTLAEWLDGAYDALDGQVPR